MSSSREHTGLGTRRSLEHGPSSGRKRSMHSYSSLSMQTSSDCFVHRQLIIHSQETQRDLAAIQAAATTSRAAAAAVALARSIEPPPAAVFAVPATAPADKHLSKQRHLRPSVCKALKKMRQAMNTATNEVNEQNMGELWRELQGTTGCTALNMLFGP